MPMKLMKKNVFALHFFAGLTMLMIAPPAFAAPGGAADMFANFYSSGRQIFNFLGGAAFVAGFLITASSVFKFKEYAESGGRMTLKTPIMLLVAGVLLVGLQSTISIASGTMGLGPMDFGVSRVGNVSNDGFNAAMRGILMFVKVVGVIAVFRGILILKKIGEGQQGGEMGRALTHILGGAAAVNINATINMLANTVGMTL